MLIYWGTYLLSISKILCPIGMGIECCVLDDLGYIDWIVTSSPLVMILS